MRQRARILGQAAVVTIMASDGAASLSLVGGPHRFGISINL
jgi:hypothetical protein